MKVTRTTMTQYAIDQIREISAHRKKHTLENLQDDRGVDGYLQGKLDAACELLGSVTTYDKDGEAEGE